MTTAHDIIRQNVQFVALPEIAIRLNEMVNDPLSTAADIGAAVNRDPVLSARLLSLVNSPLYGFPSRIDSISLAITILGTRQLRDLVLATAVIKRFNKHTPLPFEIGDFWRHSLCCAVAARAFANRMRVANRERYFVAGLLHDVGKIALYTAMPNRARQLMQRAGDDDANPIKLERSIFGIDHTEIGAELLRHWRLPESLVEPIAHHHVPHHAEHYPREAAVLHVANAIANSLQPDLPGDRDERYDPRAWRLLNMSGDVLEEVIDEVNGQFDDTLKLLYHDNAA